MRCTIFRRRHFVNKTRAEYLIEPDLDKKINCRNALQRSREVVQTQFVSKVEGGRQKWRTVTDEFVNQ